MSWVVSKKYINTHISVSALYGLDHEMMATSFFGLFAFTGGLMMGVSFCTTFKTSFAVSFLTLCFVLSQHVQCPMIPTTWHLDYFLQIVWSSITHHGVTWLPPESWNIGDGVSKCAFDQLHILCSLKWTTAHPRIGQTKVNFPLAGTRPARDRTSVHTCLWQKTLF